MTDELSVTAKQLYGVLYMPKRINKKVSKIMDASALEKFKDTQAKNEHFERYNKETDKDKKKKMLSEAVAEGWL